MRIKACYLYLTAICAAAGHWLLGADVAQGSERAARASTVVDGEPTPATAQKSAAWLVGVVAGTAPHGSAGSFCALQGASATGALPAVAGGDKPVDQKSATLEVEGFCSMVGVPMHPHGSSGMPASEPCEDDDAAVGNAGHGEDAADTLPHGSAVATVAALNPKGSAGS